MDVIYQGYELSALLICREGFEMWLLKVLLYHFDIVKMHCLDWVMWQFSLSQHISDYIDTGDELHGISRKGKREEN